MFLHSSPDCESGGQAFPVRGIRITTVVSGCFQSCSYVLQDICYRPDPVRQIFKPVWGVRDDKGIKEDSAIHVPHKLSCGIWLINKVAGG